MNRSFSAATTTRITPSIIDRATHCADKGPAREWIDCACLPMAGFVFPAIGSVVQRLQASILAFFKIGIPNTPNDPRKKNGKHAYNEGVYLNHPRAVWFASQGKLKVQP